MFEQRDDSRDSGDWLIRAITSGFIATASLTVVLAIAYWLSLTLGSADSAAPLLLRWAWALAHNVVTRNVATSLPLAALLHFIAGIGWALIYAAFVECRLTGPGWRRGAIFSLLPWAVSVVAFLPSLGGGAFGANLGAGPLPAVGNLLLHLVYGVVLGELCLPLRDVPSGEDELFSKYEIATLLRAGRTTAIGIVFGLVAGALAGLLIDMALAGQVGAAMALLLGAVVGSAIGALIGSFWGLTPRRM